VRGAAEIELPLLSAGIMIPERSRKRRSRLPVRGHTRPDGGCPAR